MALITLPSAAALGILGQWLIGSVGAIVGVGLPALLVAGMAVGMYRSAAQVRRQVERDLAEAKVEVLEVSIAPAWLVPSQHSSTDPSLAFELDERILVLVGPWLSDPRTFGGTLADDPPNDAREEYANGMLPPFAFPTRRFAVHRFPHTGLVTRIDLLDGAYCAPTPYASALDFTPIASAPSWIVEASIADLPVALGLTRARASA